MGGGTERGPGGSIGRNTGHFVHNPDYVIVTAEAHGLRPVGGKTVLLREENGNRVPGYIGILGKL